jgi:hypothetical protein
MICGGLASMGLFVSVLVSMKYLFNPYQTPGATAISALFDHFLFVSASMTGHGAGDAARLGRAGGRRPRRVGARRDADSHPHDRRGEVRRAGSLCRDVRRRPQRGVVRHRAGVDGVEAADHGLAAPRP